MKIGQLLRWGAWTLVISALGCLAVPSAAQADIVYSGPLNIEINSGTGTGSATIDFGGVAVDAFEFSYFDDLFAANVRLFADDLGTSQFVLDSGFAANLPAMTLVENSSNWSGGLTVLNGDSGGNFAPTLDGYLGVRFQDASNQTLYGWIGYESLSSDNTATAGRITGWAYETTGAPIFTAAIPEPSTALVLMIAASGLTLARRRR